MSGVKIQDRDIYNNLTFSVGTLNLRPDTVAKGIRLFKRANNLASEVQFFTNAEPWPAIKPRLSNNLRIVNGVNDALGSSVWLWATGQANSGVLGFEIFNNSNFDRSLYMRHEASDWTWLAARRDPSGGQPPVQTNLVWEYTQGGEILRIIDNEGILIGTATRMTGMGDINIQTKSPNLTTSALRLVYPANFSSSRQIWRMFTSSTSGARAAIVVTTTTVAFQALSDYRMKTNIQPMTGAVDIVKNLRPVRYHRIDDPDDAPLTDGFVAHEVQAVFPEAVFGEKDAMDRHNEPRLQTIDRHRFIPLLVSAVQELKSRIEKAEARVQTLN